MKFNGKKLGTDRDDDIRVNDSSENPFKTALILAGLKDCNEWHDP